MFNRLLYDDMDNMDFKRLKIIGILILVTIGILIIGSMFLSTGKKETVSIELNGESTITLKQYEVYNELGITANSSEYGDISNDVYIEGNVNTKIVGVYQVRYTLIGYDNYSVERTVKVTANSINDSNIATHTISNDIYTKDVIKINLAITLTNYNYTVLPSSLRTYSKSIIYDVTNNGTYTFYIYDKNNKSHKYDVVVGNIDTTAPTASCTAQTLNNQTIITVSASDSGSGIKGYSYSLNGNYSEYTGINKYAFTGSANMAYVRVKDNAGNIKNINCIVTNNGTTTYKPPFVYDNSKPILECDTYTQEQWQALANQLVMAVDAAGRGTRAGAVAAARFLAGLPYRLPYQGARRNQDIGQYYHLGLNSNPTNGWGCNGNGMDCNSYVSWALLNGGVNTGKMEVGSDYGPRRYLLDVVNQIKVGDMAFQKSRKEGENFSHIGMVIGIDSNYIYVAEARGSSLIVTPVSKTEKHYVFTYVALADIYPAEGKITNMW